MPECPKAPVSAYAAEVEAVDVRSGCPRATAARKPCRINGPELGARIFWAAGDCWPLQRQAAPSLPRWHLTAAENRHARPRDGKRSPRRPEGDRRLTSRCEYEAWLSGDAELIPLGVGHDDVVSGELMQRDRASGSQACDLVGDA
jgi:hypothetical protein